MNGPTVENLPVYCAPENWYTNYWSNCVSKQLSSDLNSCEFCEFCEYKFDDDERIYTGDFQDLY